MEMPLKFTSRYDEALAYARELHAKQCRKATAVPYIAHLMSVSAIVIEHGGDEDEAIAGLLHDAIEDQGGDETRQEIRSKFGDRVTAIVDGCTDAETSPKPPWKARKEAYIAHIATTSPSVRLVSSADKLHNARSILSDYRNIGEAVWDRFTASREETLWYYRSLVTAFRAVDSTHLIDELDLVVTELERLVAANR